MKVEHEYERKGALNLFAAFDTRTGKVWGQTYDRKRQVELIAFLEYLDKEIPAHITQVHVETCCHGVYHFQDEYAPGCGLSNDAMLGCEA